MVEVDRNATNATGTENVKYLITLVHGTFARETAWVKDGSPLRTALDKLGGVQFDVFKWSGGNTHTARLAAGEQLARHLDDMAATYPNAKRVVIAHSHGGNVALYAGRHLADQGNLQNLICLATPFLRCEVLKAGFRWTLNLAGASLAVGTMLYVWAMAIWRIASGLPILTREAGSGEVDILGQYFGSNLQMLWLSGFVVLTFTAMSAYARATLADRLRQFAWPSLSNARVLSTIYKIDEAESFLKYVDAIATRPSRFLWILLEWIGFLLVAMLFFLGAFGLLWLLLTRTVHPTMLMGFPAILATTALTYTLTFILLAPIAYIFPLLRGNPWAFGWEPPSWALLFHISPSDRPQSLVARSLEHFEIAIGSFGKHKWMAHTVIYNDERIQKKLVDWIASEPAVVSDASIISSGDTQFSSNEPWSCPWQGGNALAILALPLMLATGFTLGLKLGHREIWLDFERQQYLLSAVLAAWGGIYGIAVVGAAALFKCLRYAGEFSVPGIDKLRVVLRGSLGEAAALISVGILFAQRHRLRLVLRANSLPARHAVFLGTLALLTVSLPSFAGVTVMSWPYVWLVLVAFLFGLSALPLAGAFIGVALITALAAFVALAGLAPMGRLEALPLPSWIGGISLTLSAPVQALHLVLVALLGRGLRQRLWLGAGVEERNVLATALTSVTGLIVWGLLCLLLLCFDISAWIGTRSGTDLNRLLAFHPQVSHVIALVAFTAGALHGARAVMVATMSYLVLGLALPTALALALPPPEKGVHSLLVHLAANDYLQLDYAFGHLWFGRGLELPLYSLLGTAVARCAPELQSEIALTAQQVNERDAAALRADGIEPEPLQFLPILAFRQLDRMVPLALAALIGWLAYFAATL